MYVLSIVYCLRTVDTFCESCRLYCAFNTYIFHRLLQLKAWYFFPCVFLIFFILKIKYIKYVLNNNLFNFILCDNGKTNSKTTFFVAIKAFLS